MSATLQVDLFKELTSTKPVRSYTAGDKITVATINVSNEGTLSVTNTSNATSASFGSDTNAKKLTITMLYAVEPKYTIYNSSGATDAEKGIETTAAAGAYGVISVEI